MTQLSNSDGLYVGKEQQQRKDLYQQVTDIILEQLEAGVTPWHKPWNGQGINLDLPQNCTSGKNYRGINILLLWCSAMKNEFASNEWATFKQWKEQKESIRKGEKGSLVVYFDFIEKEQDNGDTKKIPFLKSYVVFNRCQLASYETTYTIEAPKAPLVERIGKVDEFVKNTGALIAYEDNMAVYRTQEDKIYMPDLSHFVDTDNSTATEGFYGTLLHELTHWTGHEKRLNRKLRNKFGSELYAEEELVAELGSAFLCADLGITLQPKPNHASYIASWLKALRDNKHFIVTAAGAAAKAAEYLQRYQPVCKPE